MPSEPLAPAVYADLKQLDFVRRMLASFDDSALEYRDYDSCKLAAMLRKLAV